jgi:hypothetical protein
MLFSFDWSQYREMLSTFEWQKENDCPLLSTTFPLNAPTGAEVSQTTLMFTFPQNWFALNHTLSIAT